MSTEWMPVIRLPLSTEQFGQLPRNPAYRYEFVNKEAILSPRPRHYHACLDLPMAASNRSMYCNKDGVVPLSPIESDRLSELVPLFCGAFRYTQPYGSLDDATRREAARQALERTRSGGDGPLIERASFIAKHGNEPIGAILITLLPGDDPSDADSYYWRESPPANSIERRLGSPHLTWVFVAPPSAGQGIGTALLNSSASVLRDLGFTRLLSTFMSGNESSMLWHWRKGFTLASGSGLHLSVAERRQFDLDDPARR
jgi:GNAT superfamily N-acetyltransferase